LCGGSLDLEVDMAGRKDCDMEKVKSFLADFELLGYRFADNECDRSEPSGPRMERIRVGSVKGGIWKV
jgi:hypothetical protein